MTAFETLNFYANVHLLIPSMVTGGYWHLLYNGKYPYQWPK